MIKRFLIILTCLLFVTGCGEKKIEYTFKDKENYNFIKFETNKINDLTSIFNIKTKGKVIGYLYTNSNDEIYKIIIKNDEINIKVYYSSFGNIKNYYSKLDDSVVEDKEHDKKIDIKKNSHNK